MIVGCTIVLELSRSLFFEGKSSKFMRDKSTTVATFPMLLLFGEKKTSTLMKLFLPLPSWPYSSVLEPKIPGIIYVGTYVVQKSRSYFVFWFGFLVNIYSFLFESGAS